MRAPATPRLLVGLSAAVLAAHLLLLNELPSLLLADEPSHPAPVFSTRTLPSSAAPARPAAPPAPKADPATRTSQPAPTKPAATEAEAVAAADAPPVSGAEVDQAPVSFGPHGAESAKAAHPSGEENHAAAHPPAAAASSSAVSATAAASATGTHFASASAPGVQLLAEVPPSARLRYSVAGRASQLPYSANAELLWQHDGQHYSTRLEIKAFLVGSRAQTSEGDITPQGLAPRRFADKARSEQATHFQRDSQRITFSANTPDAALQPGAQDRLSLFVQLGALLAANPDRLRAGGNLTLQVAGARQAEPWLIHLDGDEHMALPSGDGHVFKLSRAPRSEYDPRVELWVAPTLHYLPVRIRLTQSNGDYADQVLTGLELLNTPAASSEGKN